MLISGDAVFVKPAGLGGALEDMDEVNKRTLRRLLNALDRFRLVRQTIPLHLLTALFRVALDEGKSVKQYAQESAVSTSTMSRHLLDLGSEYRSGEQGLGLVEKRVSAHSLREQEVYLTPKGRKIIGETIQIMLHGKTDAAL